MVVLSCRPQWNTIAVATSPIKNEVLILQGHQNK